MYLTFLLVLGERGGEESASLVTALLVLVSVLRVRPGAGGGMERTEGDMYACYMYTHVSLLHSTAHVSQLHVHGARTHVFTLYMCTIYR